ncbi:hypothetical protein BJX62DRAFT_234283 [Aspergillus germanicus]
MLQRSGDHFLQLTVNFDELVSDPSPIPLHCYYETVETEWMQDGEAIGLMGLSLAKGYARAILVDRDSATPGSHMRTGRAVPHPLINKFQSPDDPDYIALKDIIVGFVNGAYSMISARSEIRMAMDSVCQLDDLALKSTVTSAPESQNLPQADEYGTALSLPNQASIHETRAGDPQEPAGAAVASPLLSADVPSSHRPASGFVGSSITERTVTLSASQSDPMFSFGGHESTNATEVLELADTDDTRTVYSNTMTLPGSTKESYATELCEQILGAISSIESADETLRQLSEALPDYLRAFALRFGSAHQTDLQAQGQITAFVHKYREYISETFVDRYEEQTKPPQPFERDTMQLDDIMNMWYSHDETTPDEADSPELPMPSWSREPDRGEKESSSLGSEEIPGGDKDSLNRTIEDHLPTRLPNLEKYHLLLRLVSRF